MIERSLGRTRLRRCESGARGALGVSVVVIILLTFVWPLVPSSVSDGPAFKPLALLALVAFLVALTVVLICRALAIPREPG